MRAVRVASFGRVRRPEAVAARAAVLDLLRTPMFEARRALTEVPPPSPPRAPRAPPPPQKRTVLGGGPARRFLCRRLAAVSDGVGTAGGCRC